MALSGLEWCCARGPDASRVALSATDDASSSHSSIESDAPDCVGYCDGGLRAIRGFAVGTAKCAVTCGDGEEFSEADVVVPPDDDPELTRLV